MSASENKKMLQVAFDALARGDGKPFVELWAPDFSWTITGNTAWSRTYQGKEAVQRELMAPLFANFATRYTNHATRFIAEDDFVVVECRGNVTTKSGQPYNNSYCYVCRMSGGKLTELTEYLDTELVTKVLSAPKD
ncbi:MAG: ketosteroid isomerase [Spirochaetes bacterium RBG_16_49_21]|nr:MAG: ketosteroid isomerase [Spirochaetes bacterium RBG_16_49_21]